jgi:dolichyl-phosphate-mannose-protein mannosyltransferase
MASSQRWPTKPVSGNTVAVALLAIGLALRLYHFDARRSLWIDEARLSLNILTRNYRDLLRPLDYDQSAPPLFLWLERLSTSAFGVSELSLRLVPLLAGLWGLFLLYRISRRLLPGVASQLLVLFWGAFGPLLVYYSNEVKPYSLDMLVALLLIHETLGFLQPSTGDRPRESRLLILGVIAPWASTPAIFTLAAVLVALWIHGTSVRATRRGPLLIALAWAISAASAYWLVYRAAAENPYLHRYWSEGMIRLAAPGSLDRAAFAVQDVFAGVFLGLPTQSLLPASAKPALYGLTVLMVALVARGALRLLRESPPSTGILLVGPFGLALLGSSVGVYPIAFRLMLFAVPAILILTAAGAEGLVLAFNKPARRVLWVWLGVALCGVPLQRDIGDAREARTREHLRPAIAFLKNAARPTEAVYVVAGALPAWVYYTTDWSAPDRLRLSRAAQGGSSGGAAFENARSGDIPSVLDPQLTHRVGNRVEAFGRASGVQYRYWWGTPGEPPTKSWATREARRVRRLGDASWIVLSHTPNYRRELFRALRSEGALLTLSYDGDDVMILRSDFGRRNALYALGSPTGF